MKQNNTNIYLVFILGIIIVIFAILKQISSRDSKEGMTNNDAIIRPDGYKVKRRTRNAIIKDTAMKNYKEGLKLPTLKQIGSAITNTGKDVGKKIETGSKSAGKTIEDGAKKAAKTMEEKTDGIFKKIGEIFKKLGKFFIWIGDVFKSLFSHIKCGFYRVFKLPKCAGWYLLEIIGHILYIPFGFFFWATGTQNIEKQIWDAMEQIDCLCYDTTGYHLIHYSDEIINNCYKCKITPIPKFPF